MGVSSEPQGQGKYLLNNIYGEQKIVKSKIKFMKWLNHKIIFAKT